MIKTVIGFTSLLILTLLGFLALVGGVVKLVRLIRRLGSMSRDDLEHEIKRLEMARQSSKRWRKKRKGPVPLAESVLGSMSVKAIFQRQPTGIAPFTILFSGQRRSFCFR
jgi:hypothetical protein